VVSDWERDGVSCLWDGRFERIGKYLSKSVLICVGKVTQGFEEGRFEILEMISLLK
jgi:hypothetical protein